MPPKESGVGGAFEEEQGTLGRWLDEPFPSQVLLNQSDELFVTSPAWGSFIVPPEQNSSVFISFIVQWILKSHLSSAGSRFRMKFLDVSFHWFKVYDILTRYLFVSTSAWTFRWESKRQSRVHCWCVGSVKQEDSLHSYNNECCIWVKFKRFSQFCF